MSLKTRRKKGASLALALAIVSRNEFLKIHFFYDVTAKLGLATRFLQQIKLITVLLVELSEKINLFSGIDNSKMHKLV